MDLNTNSVEDIRAFFRRLSETFINLKAELGLAHCKVNNMLDSNQALHKEISKLEQENKYLSLQLDRNNDEIKALKQEIIKLRTPIIHPLPPIQFELAPVQKKIVTLDETDLLVEGVSYYSADFLRFFCMKSKNVLGFSQKNHWPDGVLKKVDDRSFIGYHYEIDGSFAVDLLKKYNPSREVFYKAADFDEKASDIIRSFKNGNDGRIKAEDVIQFKGFSHLRFIRHSAVIRLILPLKEGTESWKRFQKYKDQKPQTKDIFTMLKEEAMK